MGIIKAKQKNESGKKSAKEIRNAGDVPAIIYGQKKSPVSISMNPVDFVKQLNNSPFKQNEIFDVEINGDQKERVIAKKISVNPINNQFIHIDFLRVDDKHPIVVNIPIRTEGVSAGQRLGGVLVKPKTTVKIKCLPSDIPVDIEVNVTGLGIGDNVRTEQLSLSGSQTIVSNPKDILVKIESTKISKTAMAAGTGA